MDAHVKLFRLLAIATLFSRTAVSAQAQDPQHVVSITDLNKDVSRQALTRRSDEEAVRSLLSSEQGQKALKSAHLNYERVDKAVGQLSDEDLAKLAQRSRQAQTDFAAGRISNGAIIVIVAVVAATIILVTVFVQLNHS